MAGGVSLRKSHITRNDNVPGGFSTEPGPHGSGRVGILTHPYATAACAAGVVTTGTAGKHSSRRRCHEI